MGIAPAAATAAQEFHHLSVFIHIAKELTGFGIIHRRSARHLNGAVFAILTVALVFVARAAIGGKNVAHIFQVNQRPEVAVSFQVNVSSSAAIATIRSALRHIFAPVKVCRAIAPTPTAAHNFHIVDKI